VYQLLVFGHVLFIVTAIAVAYGPLLLLELSIRSGRVEALRAVSAAAGPIVKAIPVLYVTAGIFGVLAALNAGFNLLAAWLVIAFVLFIALFAIGAGVIGPWAERVGKLAATAPDGPLTPEILAVTGDGRMKVLRVVDLGIVVLLIFDMVVKPFS
jgi:hypothetical protein